MLSGEFFDQFELQVRLIAYYYRPAYNVTLEGTLPDKNMRNGVYAKPRLRGEAPCKWDKGKPEVPFMGGIQVIVCGDPYQLPPIVGKLKSDQLCMLDHEKLPRAWIKRADHNPQEVFLNRGQAWESRAWWAGQFRFVELTQC